MTGLSQRKFKPYSSRILSRERKEEQFFPHLCALWEPASPKALQGGDNPSGLRIGDMTYQLANARQSCFYSATPETDSATVLGRVQNANIFTLDKFTLPSGVEVADAWVLVVLTQGDNYLDTFVIQGQPQSQMLGAMHSLSCQLIYGRRVSPRPDGVNLFAAGINEQGCN